MESHTKPYFKGHPLFKEAPSSIRRWAKENGHEVSSRGRLSSDILRRYQRKLRRDSQANTKNS
jgi:hypothetical protein